LNFISLRPIRYAWRKEIAICSAAPELNGVALSEHHVLEELQQQVKWIVENVVSGPELTEFNHSGKPLRIEEPANGMNVAQLIRNYRTEIAWIAATTRWPSLKTHLEERLAEVAKLPTFTSEFQ